MSTSVYLLNILFSEYFLVRCDAQHKSYHIGFGRRTDVVSSYYIGLRGWIDVVLPYHIGLGGGTNVVSPYYIGSSTHSLRLPRST